jgi:hypothetical protein
MAKGHPICIIKQCSGLGLALCVAQVGRAERRSQIENKKTLEKRIVFFPNGARDVGDHSFCG